MGRHLMRRAAAFLLVAAFNSGCATTRYVSVPCISRAQLDQLRAQEPPKVRQLLNGQADHDLKIIAANDIRFRAYADGLLTVLGGCVEK